MPDPNIITGNDTSESLSGTNGVDIIYGGKGWDHLWGLAGDDILYGEEGNDQLYGEAGNDVLIGGRGDDVLFGGEGANVYRFSAGDGHDSIDNMQNSVSDDFIEFDGSINVADVRVEDDLGSPWGLKFTFIGRPDDSVRVSNYFYWGYPGQIGGIRFADGTVWDSMEVIRQLNRPTDENQSLVGTDAVDVIEGGGGNDSLYGRGGDDVLSGGTGDDYLTGEQGNDSLDGGEGNDRLYGNDGDDLLMGGDGDDELYGDSGDDVLVGGAGNDYLSGGEGNDTYRFGPGFGIDTIDNYHWYSDSRGTVEFTGDLVSTLFTASMVDGHLVLTDGTNQLTIRYYENYPDAAIDEVRFADGVTWGPAQLRQMTLLPTDSDQVMRGSSGDDVIDGGGGNDTLYGEAGNDILIGGTGNDLLEGGDGNDVYRFGLGFGSDVIQNTRYKYGAATSDFIEFEAGISASSLRVSRVGDTMELRLDGYLDDVIRVLDFYQPLGDYSYHIDGIRFADGTVIDHAELNRIGNPPTDEGREIHGTTLNDTLDGGGGDDYMYAGAGDDVLFGGTGNDRLYGDVGNDSLFGGDDADYLAGEEGDDFLDGGQGDDELDGGSGDDTYYYQRGNGLDTVYAYTVSGNDEVLFGPGLSAADVVVINDGIDLSFRTLGDGGGIAFLDFRWWQPSLSLRFADGTELDSAQLQAATLWTQTADVTGTTLTGDEFGDYLIGQGGKDTLRGLEGDDLLEGGAGDDILIGGLGNDTYYFASGWGKDTIRTLNPAEDGIGLDRIYFVNSISAVDLTVASTASDLILTHATTGDRITVGGFFSHIGQDGDRAVDEVRFVDGTVWSVDDLILGQQQGTGAAQYIHGRSVDDTIDAGGGNDTVFGYAGDDILDGGAGNDRLDGGSGSDTYRFQLGWGRDVVAGSGAEASGDDVDVLEFGAGVVGSDLRVVSGASDLLLQHANGDSITLEGVFTDPHSIQEVRFADGTTWNLDDLLDLQLLGDETDQYQQGTSRSDLIQGLGGNDLLYGRGGADTLDGGEGDDVLDGGVGNDSLEGGDGNDMFVFSRGSGQDRATSQDPDGIFWDVVQLGEGIAAEQVTLSRDGRDVVLSLTGTDDSLTLVDFLPEVEGDWPTAFDEVWFADGTIWDAYSIIGALPTAGSEGTTELNVLVAAMAVPGAGSGAAPLVSLDDSGLGQFRLAHVAI
ncbi:calcium-binding protein [uncultured Stenotrophomonas sp.]|uniref:calcium-binding protein n=1 Tax=uncultured Stenotrophomonas sp. TaxID=165438 RepID=UPI0028D42C1F|nr:calcium-binding protein [uncultured Stenotrophomonas sp.]